MLCCLLRHLHVMLRNQAIYLPTCYTLCRVIDEGGREEVVGKRKPEKGGGRRRGASSGFAKGCMVSNLIIHGRIFVP